MDIASRSRFLPQRAVAAALVGCLLLVVGVPAAAADHSDTTIFDPPGSSLLYKPVTDRANELDQLQALGATTVRVPVDWRNYVPSPTSSARPQAFDGADPTDYPSGPFSVLDATIRAIDARGMDVLLTPGGPAPRWATAGGTSGFNRPDPGEFRQFVDALGQRYSGDCTCGTSAVLPRVSFWSVWNEPNLFLFLTPQVVHGQVVSGLIYRKLFLAAQAGLGDSGHGGDPLLIGETAPSKGTISSRPLEFLRAVFCLDARWHRIGHCTPIHATGWAQHPYLPGIPPWATPSRNYISIGSLGRLTRALRLAYRAGATAQRLPVYVTEFGVESYPEPAGRFGVSQQRQAEYMAISEWMLYENPQVRSYAQFLITDDPGKYSYLSFQTGLRLANGTAKLSYYSFPMALAVRQLTSNAAQIWGHVRPGSGYRSVSIDYRDTDQIPHPLQTLSTDQNGYFSLTSAFEPGRQWRATAELADGRILQGPWIRSYRFQLPG